MVADKAGIRRQSIYGRHFNSIEDIITTIHSIIDNEIAEKVKDAIANTATDPITYFSKEMLPLLYNRRDWLKVLYGTVIDDSWINFLQDKYTPIFRAYLEKVGNKSGFSNDFLSGLIVSQVIAILGNWLTSNTPEPASLFRKKFMRILNTSTFDLLTNS
ncbi:MAG: TetR/AcrR family transcriptional regulator [Lactobacillus sp.]|jgi:hypothetical protein|nr:TetR/AcrR family transcriptional regulator [Lactobacillus sp.]